MAKTRIMYVELKTGYSDNGPGWIGRVTFSKSGQTVYFNGKALKRNGGMGISGNHFDLETRDEYWVSGVKKDGTDRHKHGSGKILIDARVVEEYLAEVGQTKLDPTKFEVCNDIVDTDIERLSKIENTRL